jgi:hypothetical protein
MFSLIKKRMHSFTEAAREKVGNNNKARQERNGVCRAEGDGLAEERQCRGIGV